MSIAAEIDPHFLDPNSTMTPSIIVPSSEDDSWVRRNADSIAGESGEYFGTSFVLSLDGTHLAVGAPLHNGRGGSNSGKVVVFEWVDSTWLQKLDSGIEGEGPGDRFGRSVALSADGKRIAVGAERNRSNGRDSGHVRVWEWIGAGWTLLGEPIKGIAEGEYSGWAVSMSADGSRVAIGAPRSHSNGAHSGQVRIFEWSRTTWSLLGGKGINGTSAGDELGTSVSLSADGTRVAIGAPGRLLQGSSAGQLLIYEWTGIEWSRMSGSHMIGGQRGDYFGGSVMLSSNGSVVVVGSQLYNGDQAMTIGLVRVLKWNGSVWAPLGNDIMGKAAFDQLGVSVSLSADNYRLAIGAACHDESCLDSGHVRVLEWNGSGWQQIGQDLISDEIMDRFGRPVVLSSDGKNLYLGASSSDMTGNNAGQIHWFTWRND